MTSYGEDSLGTSSNGAPSHSTTRTSSAEWNEWKPRVRIGQRYRLGLRVSETYLLSRSVGASVEAAVLVCSKNHGLDAPDVFSLLRWMGIFD